MTENEPRETRAQDSSQSEEPDFFDRTLLQQPPGIRQEYFEQNCLIAHPRLMEALESILQAICAPGDGGSQRRPGTMVLGIGPSRVGKTTLIRLLEDRLLAYARAQMRRDPTVIPLVSMTAPEPGSGRFDWIDFYKPVLRQLGNPFVDSDTARIPTRRMREAVEAAYLERKPLAIIVDEAHHLAKVRSGRRLQDHLDHLKYFENLTGVSHILIGTYELRPFRQVNPQLACRSVDVHFPRYDLTKDEDCQIFRSVLWALQRQLPVEEEPLLAEQHWEMLYARSIGCIGLLKLHLNRALALALSAGATTVTEQHLRQTAMSAVRVQVVLRNALESEAELRETPYADADLLTLLRKPAASAGPSAPSSGQVSSPAPHQQPGKRAPGRDAIGRAAEGTAAHEPAEEERAAG